MTRRKFVCKLIETWPVVAVGASALARRASAQKARLRKFVRAARMNQYPGPIKPLHDICRQGKWSG
ncbi:MAG TPA: hypothetical protein VMW24_24395 [Sedimentisphaerales bacterium]|nr:hypothetical protein [Sedimentisphaerales bacterium]